jgi:imidazolonepropionase-like amidohydrolase
MLIKNAVIFTMETEREEFLKGDILIEGSKVRKIAPAITAAGEEIFDARGQTIIPGIVDASSRLGLRASGMRWEGDEINEDSENNISDLSVLDGINPLDETFREASRGGITSAVITSGEKSVIGAKSAAIKVRQQPSNPAVLEPFIDIGITFGNHVKRLNDRGEFPRSRMGIAAILRRALVDAEGYGKKKARDEIDEKNYDPKSEAMFKVLEKKVPLKITAYRMDDILTAIRIKEEFSIDIILNQCIEGYKVIEEIAERKIPVIVGQYLLPVGDHEELGRRIDLPVELYRAGIPLAFSTHTEEIGFSFMRINAALAVKNGLPEYEALKALTINPARFFHLDERIGSIKEGKDADLLILDGNPLFSMTRVIKTMVDGIFTD